jgi:hypothetical protein
MTKEEKIEFLKSKGWSTWYHEDYWVHEKTVVDPTRQDYTNYGMDLYSAYEYEINGGKPFDGMYGYARFRKADIIMENETVQEVKKYIPPPPPPPKGETWSEEVDYIGFSKKQRTIMFVALVIGFVFIFGLLITMAIKSKYEVKPQWKVIDKYYTPERLDTIPLITESYITDDLKPAFDTSSLKKFMDTSKTYISYPETYGIVIDLVIISIVFKI